MDAAHSGGDLRMEKLTRREAVSIWNELPVSSKILQRFPHLVFALPFAVEEGTEMEEKAKELWRKTAEFLRRMADAIEKGD